MSDRAVRLIRLLLALALVGVGPGMRTADVLLFHATGAPATPSHQVDDGTASLPHGDSCVLALPASPALNGATWTPELRTMAEVSVPRAVPATVVPATRAARPPPSRAPPTLQA